MGENEKKEIVKEPEGENDCAVTARSGAGASEERKGRTEGTKNQTKIEVLHKSAHSQTRKRTVGPDLT